MKEQTNQCITHTSHRGRGIPPLSTDRGNKEPRRRGERERGRYTHIGGRRKRKATIREKVITMARSRAWARLGPSSARLQEKCMCLYHTSARAVTHASFSYLGHFVQSTKFFLFFPSPRPDRKEKIPSHAARKLFLLFDWQTNFISYFPLFWVLPGNFRYISIDTSGAPAAPATRDSGRLFIFPSVRPANPINFLLLPFYESLFDVYTEQVRVFLLISSTLIGNLPKIATETVADPESFAQRCNSVVYEKTNRDTG